MPGEISKENGKKGGRPKGSKARHTLEASALRAYIVQEVVKRKKKLVKAMIDKAVKGDIIAIREALDRTLGKAKEQVDITVTRPIPILGNVSKDNSDKEDNESDKEDKSSAGGNVSVKDSEHNPVSD